MKPARPSVAAVVTLAAAIWPGARLGAQPTTGGGWTGWMDIGQPACIERARRAITSQALEITDVDAWFVHFEGRGFVGGITCIADDGTTNLVNGQVPRVLVVVGIERSANDTGPVRDALAAFMLGHAAGGGIGGATYRRVGDYIVSYHDIPGVPGAGATDRPSLETCEALCTGNPDCKGFSRRKPDQAAPWCQFYDVSMAQAQADGTLIAHSGFDYYERVNP